MQARRALVFAAFVLLPACAGAAESTGERVAAGVARGFAAPSAQAELARASNRAAASAARGAISAADAPAARRELAAVSSAAAHGAVMGALGPETEARVHAMAEDARETFAGEGLRQDVRLLLVEDGPELADVVREAMKPAQDAVDGVLRTVEGILVGLVLLVAALIGFAVKAHRRIATLEGK